MNGEDPLESGLRGMFSDENLGDVHMSVTQFFCDAMGFNTGVSLKEDWDEQPSPINRSCNESVTIPAQLGKYRVVGEIGRGGIGAILRARDEDLGRDVALKVLLDSHDGNAEITRRFLEEAQIGGQLQHPGIVPIHELGVVADKKPYIAMKLVKGQTLARLISDRSDPAEDRQRFLCIFEQICQPLAYAHARGVIHRDLKPSNVMVGAFGQVQVMDWGLAKVLAEGGTADDDGKPPALADVSVIETIRSMDKGSASLAGSVAGTPAYMPPEQARGDISEVDERSDVFGLGAILCEILTGSPPYCGDTPSEIYKQAKRGYLDDAWQRLDHCGADPEVVDLTKRCLAFESRDRPRDARLVVEAITSYLDI